MRCVLAWCFRARDAEHIERSARGIARRGLCRPRADGSARAPVPGDYALAETPVEVDCDDAVVWAVLDWANCGRSCCKVA
jgi:hypothetical protein